MATPRELALKILYDIEKNGAWLNISFKNHTESAGIDGRDAALVKELTYGVVQYKLTLDYVIARFSSVKLKKLAPFVLCILSTRTHIVCTQICTSFILTSFTPATIMTTTNMRDI